jgi:hypothetical protein
MRRRAFALWLGAFTVGCFAISDPAFGQMGMQKSGGMKGAMKGGMMQGMAGGMAAKAGCCCQMKMGMTPGGGMQTPFTQTSGGFGSPVGNGMATNPNTRLQNPLGNGGNGRTTIPNMHLQSPMGNGGFNMPMQNPFLQNRPMPMQNAFVQNMRPMQNPVLQGGFLPTQGAMQMPMQNPLQPSATTQSSQSDQTAAQFQIPLLVPGAIEDSIPQRKKAAAKKKMNEED